MGRAARQIARAALDHEQLSLRTWPARRLGPQLHMSAGEPPAPELFQPVTMQDVHRRWYQPSGGFWTSSRTPSGASATIETLLRRGNGARQPRRVWRLQPGHPARVLVIDSGDDLRAVCQTFPYGEHEIDYPEVAAAGYAAVHVTAAAIQALAYQAPFPLVSWDSEATVWLRWAFSGAPRLVPYESMRATVCVEHAGAVHRITYATGWATRATAAASAAARDLYRGRLSVPALTPDDRGTLRRSFLLVLILEWVEARKGRPARTLPMSPAALRTVPDSLIDAVFEAIGASIYDRPDRDESRLLAHLATGYALPEHPVALAFVYGSGAGAGWGAVYQCRQCGWSQPATAPYQVAQMPPCPHCMA